MRGKVQQLSDRFRFLGITPAYAGKSSRSWRLKSHVKDHPRLCGEKYQSFFSVLLRSGSPPPMRGKADFLKACTSSARITPAYAGKRRFQHPFSSLRRDHPRLCGEKALQAEQTRRTQGSPPPMRGKAKTRRDKNDK